MVEVERMMPREHQTDLLVRPADGLPLFSSCVWLRAAGAGWYDGSEWYKPPDIRARDEMLNNYEVQPAVNRLKT